MSPWYNVAWLVVAMPLIGALGSFLFESPRRAAHAVIACNAVALAAAVFDFFFRFAHRHDAVSDGVFGFLQTNPQGGPGTSNLAANLQPQLGVRVDAFGSVLAMVALFVAAAVLIHATSAMRGDPGYRRIFWASSLLIFGAVALILSPNLFQAMFAAMIMSASTYILAMHWSESLSIANTAQRGLGWLLGGDFFLLVACVIAFVRLGSDAASQAPPAGQTSADPLDFTLLGGEVHRVAGHAVAGIGQHTVTFIAVGIVIAALIRCAIVPAVAWLACLKEAPLPAIALALSLGLGSGIVLLAKSWAVLLGVPHLLSVLAVLGAASALICALVALCLRELASLCTWLGAAQAGLVVATLGAGAFAPATEMLVMLMITTPVLVLACGNLVRGYRTRDLAEIGGAWRRAPRTARALVAWWVATSGLSFSIYNAVSAVSRNTFADQLTGAHGHLSNGVRVTVLVLVLAAAVATVFAASRLVATVCGGSAVARRGFALERIRDVDGRSVWALWMLMAGLLVAVLWGVPAMYHGVTLSHYVFFGTPSQLPQSLPVVGVAAAFAIVIAAAAIGAMALYWRRAPIPFPAMLVAAGRRELGIDRFLAWTGFRVLNLAGDLFYRSDREINDPILHGVAQAGAMTVALTRRTRTAKMSYQVFGAVILVAAAVLISGLVAHSAGQH